MAELKINHSPLINFLQPGVAKEYVAEQLNTLNISIPEEFYVFFGWQNGLIEEGIEDYPLTTFTLFSLANPISIKDALEIYKYNCFDFNYWEKKYFPIFESGVGDYFLIDINRDSETYKMFMYYSPANPYFQGVISKADSLQSLIETIIECYKRKIYYFTQFEGYKVFDLEPKLENEVWKRRNPKSEYWKVLESF